jgi:hypothetical protein
MFQKAKSCGNNPRVSVDGLTFERVVGIIPKSLWAHIHYGTSPVTTEKILPGELRESSWKVLGKFADFASFA